MNKENRKVSGSNVPYSTADGKMKLIVPGFSKYRKTNIYSAYHPFGGNVGLRALKNYLHTLKLGQFNPIQKINAGWICNYNNRGEIIGKTWCESYTLCVFTFEDIAINYHIETNDVDLIGKFEKWVEFNRKKFGCNESRPKYNKKLSVASGSKCYRGRLSYYIGVPLNPEKRF